MHDYCPSQVEPSSRTPSTPLGPSSRAGCPRRPARGRSQVTCERLPQACLPLRSPLRNAPPGQGQANLQQRGLLLVRAALPPGICSGTLAAPPCSLTPRGTPPHRLPALTSLTWAEAGHTYHRPAVTYERKGEGGILRLVLVPRLLRGPLVTATRSRTTLPGASLWATPWATISSASRGRMAFRFPGTGIPPPPPSMSPPSSTTATALNE